MKQIKKSNFMLAILIVSLCANLILAGALVGYIQTGQKEPVLQNGTYVEKAENGVSRRLFVLLDAENKSGDKLFYYYIEGTTEVITEGTCDSSQNGEGTLRQQDGAICGYVIPVQKDSVELVWDNGELMQMSHYDDVAVLP